MTAKILPFRFESHEVRTLLIDDQPWFCAADICRVLGYSNSRDALVKHCRESGVAKRDISSGGQNRSLSFINEGNLYRLIIKSRKEEAQRFESWVCDEVLPAIRKHGHYEDTQNKLGTLIGQTIGTDGFHMLGTIVAGKVRPLPAKQQRSAKMKLWAQLHAAFGVRSAEDIPASQLDSARQFVAAYAIEGEYIPCNKIPNVRALYLHYPARGNNWRYDFNDLHNCGWNCKLLDFINLLNDNRDQVLNVVIEDVSDLKKELITLMHIAESSRYQLDKIKQSAQRSLTA